MENSFRVVEFQFEGHTCNEGERLGMIVDQLCNFSLDGVFEHFLLSHFVLPSYCYCKHSVLRARVQIGKH